MLSSLCQGGSRQTGEEKEQGEKGRKDSRRQEGNLREGEGHQSTTNHYKVKDVPQVPEIRALVQDQSQIHHLQEKKKR